MATIYGMSDIDIAGLMVLHKQQNQFLGGGMASKDYSDEMAHKLDIYIKQTLNERYDAVKQSLKDNSEAMEEMTAELLDKEVISGKRVQEIIKDTGGEVYEGEDLHTDGDESVDSTDASQEEKDKKDE